MIKRRTRQDVENVCESARKVGRVRCEAEKIKDYKINNDQLVSAGRPDGGKTNETWIGELTGSN